MKKALFSPSLYLSLSLPVLLGTAPGCVGTTGGGLVDFEAFAEGPPGATHAFAFETPEGFAVTLQQADLRLGAVYLTASKDNPSSANSTCINPGRYVAEVPGPTQGTLVGGLYSQRMDALSPDPQPFSVGGDGTADQALTGEVWLVGDSNDVNAPEDPTPIVEVAGTAARSGMSYPFSAQVHIGQNRAMPASDPSQPGLNPICKERIVSPIPITNQVQLFQGGALFVQVDPRVWFTNVDFSQLSLTVTPAIGPTCPPGTVSVGNKTPASSCQGYVIPDDDNDTNGLNFFKGLEFSSGVYSFQFRTP